MFRRIAEVTLRHLGIAPAGRREEIVASKKEPQQKAAAQLEAAPADKIDKGESTVPDVRSLPLRQAVITLHAKSLVPEVSGYGVVISQEPAPGKSLPHGAVERLELDRRPVDPASSVPDGNPKTLTAAVSRRPHVP